MHFTGRTFVSVCLFFIALFTAAYNHFFFALVGAFCAILAKERMQQFSMHRKMKISVWYVFRIYNFFFSVFFSVLFNDLMDACGKQYSSVSEKRMINDGGTGAIVLVA